MTHGDMEQLTRRFGRGFSDNENVATLAIADLFLLLGASVVVVTTKDPEFEAFLSYHCNNVVDEIRALSGNALDEWKGWRPLPEPIVPLGEIPPELRGDA